MSLRIELDDHDQDKHYYPGQELRGNVVFQLPKQRKIASASITFRGKIDTEHIESRRSTAGNTHGPRSRAHEIIRLFEHNQTLFRGPFDLPPQTLSWPFTFTIPTSVEHRRVGNKSPGFVANGVSSLPPSFNWEDHTFTHDARARIKYKLVANIDSGGYFKNEEIELPVTILRFTIYPPPKPEPLRHDFLPTPCWSSRELRDQPHTLKQKFRHITSSDPELKTPCIAFKAWIHFPLQLSPDQKTSIAISIQHTRVTPKDPEAPELVLDALRLSLNPHNAMTASRSSGFGPSLSGDRYCQGITNGPNYAVSFDPIQLPLDGTEVGLSDDICLSDWQKVPIRPFMGDFDTYTIRRGHRIRVEADVRHPATGHVFPLRTEFRFELLDEYLPEMARSRSRIGDVGQVARYEDIDHELPAYDEDVRPPDVEGGGRTMEVQTKA